MDSWDLCRPISLDTGGYCRELLVKSFPTTIQMFRQQRKQLWVADKDLRSLQTLTPETPFSRKPYLENFNTNKVDKNGLQPTQAPLTILQARLLEWVAISFFILIQIKARQKGTTEDSCRGLCGPACLSCPHPVPCLSFFFSFGSPSFFLFTPFCPLSLLLSVLSSFL